MKNFTPYIIDFATHSFRDVADQDYIAARIAYRKAFDHQFRWCSLQAIEKYLKAILLFNSVSAKGLGHNLVKALDRVKSIPNLEFALPSSGSERFVEFISRYGADRYFTMPTHLPEEALLALDKVVWCIRRYCLYMHQTIDVGGNERNIFELNKRRATDPFFEEQRHRYRILGGYLEKVIDDHLPAYEELVWKNFFYGRVKKHKIKNFTFRISSANPTHALHPETFEAISRLVDFPKEVREQYRS